MGITYFALGMLSMLALIFVGVIVWGLVKVGKIQRQIVVIKENVRFDYDNVQRQLEDVYRRFGDITDDSIRDRGNLWRDVTDRFDKMEQNEIKRFDILSGIINEKFQDSLKYTDKRIDKTINQ